MRVLLCALGFAMALAAAPAAAQQQGHWLRAESEGFVVYGAISEQRIRGVADELEVFDALLRRMTNAPAERAPRKLDVYLLSSDRFHDIYPDMRNDVAGFYTARVDETAAFAIYSDSAGLGSREILFHEYAHHFMFQYFANAYPAWYVEGFAELIATATLGSERIVVGRANEGRLYALGAGWLPLQRLITARPLELSNDDIQKFYAESWLFAHYIFLTPGRREQFLAYVRALRTGAEPRAAFQTGFGMTPEEMQAELHRYLDAAPHAVALTRPAVVERRPPALTRLPASADQMMTVWARLHLGVAEAQRAAFLQQVRQAAGPSPRDEFAAATLAYAESRIGDIAAARALLSQRLAANPDDATALDAMGMTYVREAEDATGDARAALLSQARRQFGRAYHNDPNHVPAMYHYVRTYDGVMMDEPTSANYLNILLLAHQLAPQIDEITLNAASALMMRDRNAEAIPLLRAVAYDPHGGSGAESALQMLHQAEAAIAGAAQ